MDILRAVMGSGLTPVAGAVGAGMVGAWMLSRYIESMLYGVSPRDPLTFVTAPLFLLIVAAIACFLPAKRATSIDLNYALRDS